MTAPEVPDLADKIVGIYAYDGGAVSSGIRDEVLRKRILDYLQEQTGEYELYPRLIIGRILRDTFLSEEALAEGYGPEDVYEFMKWLEDQMHRG